MAPARKITVEVPQDLLEKAQGTNLQLAPASDAYARLRQLRGKVRFTRTFTKLKSDR